MKKAASERKMSLDRRGSKISKASRKKSEPEVKPEVVANIQRVFLYLQLKEVVDLPQSEYDLILELKQAKNTLTKLDEHYTTDTSLNLTKIALRDQSAFSIMINQDSIEDLNHFIDNPLVMTLYEYVVPKLCPQPEEGEEEEEEHFVMEECEDEVFEPYLRPLSQGVLDLFEMFTYKRILLELRIFCYPVYRPDEPLNQAMSTPTSKMTWHFYTLLPLLKDLSFSNICFITLESIYNLTAEKLKEIEVLSKPAPPAKPKTPPKSTLPTPNDELEAQEPAENLDDLVVLFSLQTKVPDAKGELQKVKLFDFKGLERHVIEEQEFNVIWESVKNQGIGRGLGLQYGIKVPKYKLFNDLLGTDGVEFPYESIEIERDTVIVCNGIHRAIFNAEVSRYLEIAIAFQEQELVIEVFREADPTDILLEGKIDLSVFLYPKINTMRLATELRVPKSKQPAKKQLPSSKASSKAPLTSRTATTEDETPPKEPPFCIIGICLLSPITEAPFAPMSHYSDKAQKKDIVRRCGQAIGETNDTTPSATRMQEECYKELENFTKQMIERIVCCNIKDIKDDKEFFCGQCENLVNILVRIIACDFNLRIETKTNEEFTRMMTTVYEEIISRQEHVLSKCPVKALKSLETFYKEQDLSLVRNLSIYKCLCDCDYLDFAERVLFGIKTKTAMKKLDFYLFFHNVEKGLFETAKSYLRKPIRERVLDGEYFAQWACIYIKYMEELADEETRIAANEHVIINVKDCSDMNSAQIDGWILLYCLYKRNNYLPGMEYARWKYENLYNAPMHRFPNMPLPRYQIYNDGEINVSSLKGIHFLEVFRRFMSMGLYKFAQYIFVELAPECTNLEIYLMQATLAVLLEEVDPKMVIQTFPVDKSKKGETMRIMLNQINGCVELARGNIPAAMRHFSRLLDMSPDVDYEMGQVALFRYGNYLTQENNYEKALSCFQRSANSEDNGMVAYFEMGRCNYMLNNMLAAEECFAKTTNCQLYLADAWGYLALINLKLGRVYKAIECWKYAKLSVKLPMSAALVEELLKFSDDKLPLYVDRPSRERNVIRQVRFQFQDGRGDE